MLIFTSALVVYGLLHLLYGRALQYIYTQVLITEQTASSMKATPFIIVLDIITKYNIKYNDQLIMDNIVKSLEFIDNYYKRMNEASSFEPFKVLPSLIYALGKTCPLENLEPVWYGIGIFLNTIAGIQVNRIQRITLQEKYLVNLRFERYCAEYGMKGIKDGSFFKIFRTQLLQERFFALFFKIAGDHKAGSLAAFLSLCELDRNRLRTTLDLMKTTVFTEGPLVFSNVIVQLYLNSRISSNQKIPNELRTLQRFVEENKFLSKTDLIIFNKLLLQ